MTFAVPWKIWISN